MGASPSNGFGASTTAELAARDVDLSGKTVVVTGANTGIGYETSRVLISRGAHVIVAARSQEKGEKAVATLLEKKGEEEVKGSAEWIPLDLSSLASVKEFSNQFLAKDRPLHILINNAGIMMIPERTLTTDGFESQFGVNHIGHFYLTKLLMPALKRAREESGEVIRIVNLSSEAHRMCPLVWDNLLSEKNYNPSKAYGQSKTANICFTIGLHNRYHDEGIHAYAVHPGVIDTELGRYSTLATIFYKAGSLFLKSIPQGAATTVYCAVAPEVLSEAKDDKEKTADGSGRYYADCNLCEKMAYANSENAEKLWEKTEELIASKNFE